MEKDGFGKRLRAARSMRDIASRDTAADMLGIGRSSYAGLERSAGCPVTKVTAYLAGRYGVTVAFLRTGAASTVADEDAEAWLGCMDPSRDTWELTDTERVAARLKMLRLMRGIRMASVAAVGFGWNMGRHTEVEAGRVRFTLAGIAVFCRAYDVPSHFFTDNATGLIYDPRFSDRLVETWEIEGLHEPSESTISVQIGI